MAQHTQVNYLLYKNYNYIHPGIHGPYNFPKWFDLCGCTIPIIDFCFDQQFTDFIVDNKVQQLDYTSTLGQIYGYFERNSTHITFTIYQKTLSECKCTPHPTTICDCTSTWKFIFPLNVFSMCILDFKFVSNYMFTQENKHTTYVFNDIGDINPDKNIFIDERSLLLSLIMMYIRKNIF